MFLNIILETVCSMSPVKVMKELKIKSSAAAMVGKKLRVPSRYRSKKYIPLIIPIIMSANPGIVK